MYRNVDSHGDKAYHLIIYLASVILVKCYNGDQKCLSFFNECMKEIYIVMAGITCKLIFCEPFSIVLKYCFDFFFFFCWKWEVLKTSYLLGFCNKAIVSKVAEKTCKF